jgi:hypothetical protein
MLNLFQHDEVVIAILSLLFMILKQVQDLRMVSVILSLSQELILMSLLGLGSETSSA